MLPRTHDANRSQSSIPACFSLERYEFVELRTATAKRKGGDVNEYLFVALGGGDEAKTSVIVPFCQLAVFSHEKRLTGARFDYLLRPQLSSRSFKRYRHELTAAGQNNNCVQLWAITVMGKLTSIAQKAPSCNWEQRWSDRDD
jgi:hypothetical protein